MSASCASRSTRLKNRSLRLSLSRPSSSNARWRSADAGTAASPCTMAAAVRRTRSKASSLVRRSPERPMLSSGAWGLGLGAWAAAGGLATALSPVLGASRCAGCEPVTSRSRRSSPRPRPRPPRRPRRPRSSRSPLDAAPPCEGAAVGWLPGARGDGIPAVPARADCSVGATSSCPFSSFVTLMRPCSAASWQNFENFDLPRFFSSNDGVDVLHDLLEAVGAHDVAVLDHAIDGFDDELPRIPLHDFFLALLHEAGERVVAVVLVAVHARAGRSTTHECRRR